MKIKPNPTSPWREERSLRQTNAQDEIPKQVITGFLFRALLTNVKAQDSHMF